MMRFFHSKENICHIFFALIATMMERNEHSLGTFFCYNSAKDRIRYIHNIQQIIIFSFLTMLIVMKNEYKFVTLELMRMIFLYFKVKYGPPFVNIFHLYSHAYTLPYTGLYSQAVIHRDQMIRIRLVLRKYHYICVHIYIMCICFLNSYSLSSLK